MFPANLATKAMLILSMKAQFVKLNDPVSN